ncbi:hypothetical protein SAMN06309944_0776 [Micrococcales bacterium KH10]|nr:hypothetical protein SAMN06309944_0776 [Micrococcales bacterium KH10]
MVGKKAVGKARVKKVKAKGKKVRWIAKVHTRALSRIGKVKVKLTKAKRLADQTVTTRYRVRR